MSEWMMALEIERLYTKRQILEMYMNYVFLGAGSYGFEAGSRTYFGKPLKDLNLEEAALLAAIPKSPEYSPTRNMEKAKMRRDIVLDQMAKYGYISESEAETAKAKPIKLADTAYYQSLPKSTAWDYPVEEIRKYLGRQIYNTRRARRFESLYDDQCQSTKDRHTSNPRRLTKHMIAAEAGVPNIKMCLKKKTKNRSPIGKKQAADSKPINTPIGMAMNTKKANISKA